MQLGFGQAVVPSERAPERDSYGAQARGIALRRVLLQTRRITQMRSRIDTFATANPALPTGSITLQCSGRYLQEVQMCVDRALTRRRCGDDQPDRCGNRVVLRPTQ